MKTQKKHAERTPWRAANRDRVREYNQRYWKRKAEQMQQNAEQEKEPSK